MREPRETAWNHLSNTGEKETHGTFFSAESKWVNRIKKLATQYPEQVEIRAENPDGSIVAHVPISWFKIKPLAKLNLSDEQKAERSARLTAYRTR